MDWSTWTSQLSDAAKRRQEVAVQGPRQLPRPCWHVLVIEPPEEPRLFTPDSQEAMIDLLKSLPETAAAWPIFGCRGYVCVHPDKPELRCFLHPDGSRVSLFDVDISDFVVAEDGSYAAPDLPLIGSETARTYRRRLSAVQNTSAANFMGPDADPELADDDFPVPDEGDADTDFDA